MWYFIIQAILWASIILIVSIVTSMKEGDEERKRRKEII
jgi:hypothetical protein